MTIGLEEYLALGALLFSLGFYIALSKKNAVRLNLGIFIMVCLMRNWCGFLLLSIDIYVASFVAARHSAWIVFYKKVTIEVA